MIVRWRDILAGLLLGSAGLGVAPASGFELFGIHLWGPREEEDRIEVIDPLPYTVDFSVAGGDADLDRALRNASSLWTDRETPASGRGGLLSKARGDYRWILAALYNAGYYGPEISIRAAGREVADLTLAAEFPPTVPVVVAVVPGPRFRFGQAEVVNAPPPREVTRPDEDTLESVGFVVGEPALATAIGQASALSIERWRELGHAKARETERAAVADHATSLLAAAVTLDPGREARYGPTRVAGSQRVDPGFIAFMADLPEGQRYDPEDIEAGQDRLARLGVFRSIRFEEADEIAPDGSLPITVRVEDRRPRTIGVGATLSTLDGLGLQAFWTHRNLFRRAEQLRVEASVEGLGATSNFDEFNYNLGITFTKPGVYTPDTNFVASLVARQLDLDTYRERSVTATAGVSQLFGKYLTGDLFAQVSKARYTDDFFGDRDFLTVGLVGDATYDRRDDPLDATRGYYLAATLQPFHEFEFGNTAVQGTLEGRIYRSVGAEPGRFVLAARAEVGSYAGATVAESPPNLLFFAGGGGSVRGYAYRSIGVEVTEPDGDSGIVGGRGLFETSGELRARFGERFGGVAFVDAGFVTADSRLGGDNELRAGAGLGFRYLTGIGPIRFDVATPIDRRPGDSAVALYIGIGQAF
jgi:translocation and assembly module TamA